ncbi:MAG: hypothetical protein IT378_25580 [Sandaracinaceae bacterium]|nr:hypothetical protein [Sandaracinaceae bacterium]
MKDERARAISDALLAPDAERRLAELVEGDAEAAAYARELTRLDDALRARRARDAEAPGEAWLARLDARLDEPIEDLDVLAAPFPDDAPAAPRAVEASPVREAASAASSAPAPKGAEVVDLAARRRRGVVYWTSGLAAAAAVVLGVVVGTRTFQENESLVMSPAPAPASEVAATPAADTAVAEAAAEPAPMAPPVAQAAPAPAPVAPAAPPALMERSVAEPAVMAPAAEPDALAVRRSREQPAPPATGGAGAGLAGAQSFGPRDVVAPSYARELATARLRNAAPSIQACAGERTEVAVARVRIGADGRVASVRIGNYTGEAAQCMTRVLTAIEMPASTSSYEAAYLYRPAPHAGSSIPAAAAPARRPARRDVIDAWAEKPALGARSVR